MDHPPVTHASDETLERYALKSLAESDALAFEEHMLACPACQDRLAETDAYVQAMQAAALRVRREPARAPWAVWGRPGRPALSLAFAAGFLLLLALWIRPWGSALPVAVMLQAHRGAMVAHSQAPAGQPLTLRMDLADLETLPAYRVEAVDEGGRRVWEGTASLRDGRAEANIPARLAKGRYYVRLYSTTNELLREYGLDAR